MYQLRRAIECDVGYLTWNWANLSAILIECNHIWLDERLMILKKKVYQKVKVHEKKKMPPFQLESFVG